ncbi:MAG: ABC transporter ATP-binding protein [Planctomycetota bacterium]|jgi:iron complex transport system ATP-binding protein
MDPMIPAIEVDDLSYNVKRKSILERVSFRVQPGEYLSVVGPNGAGKTTLLKCLNRIVPSSGGSIRIVGKSLSAYSQRLLAEKIAYVPQANGRIPPFTVQEFVLMARYPYLSPFTTKSPRDDEAVRNALAVTAMEGFAIRPMSTLSGGERQKVFIAAALAQEAPILLLDEATTFLDPKHQAEIYRILANVNEKGGATILSVTHDINAAVLAGQRILALREGRLVCCRPAREIMDNEILREIYGKEFRFFEHPDTGERLVVPEGAS